MTWTWFEVLTYWPSRVACRLGYHTLACRGRDDHDPYNGRWTDRW